MNVLISGAGIAGPALAYWLGRYGFTPTVVESAPGLRPGGQAVDFRGRTHLSVLEQMGVLDDLRAVRTGGSPMHFVDETGRGLMSLPGEFAGGDIEVLRGDLSRVLYDQGSSTAEYLFGDSITSLADRGTGVDVTFEHAPPRTFDLVIGADGMRSAVRSLAFGPDPAFVSHLGYYFATWTVPNRSGVGPESLMYNVPGRLAGISGDPNDLTKARVFAVFAADQLDYDRRDTHQQCKLITNAFLDVGWHVPALLADLAEAPDLYLDSISRVDLPNWSAGRVGLIGDAAFGATLGGMGSGTAIVAAYVLAGELATSPADHRGAFQRYEHLLRDYVRRCQKGGDRAGAFLAPRTARRIRVRNRLLSSRVLLNLMIKMGQDMPDKITLPDYSSVLGR